METVRAGGLGIRAGGCVCVYVYGVLALGWGERVQMEDNQG